MESATTSTHSSTKKQHKEAVVCFLPEPNILAGREYEKIVKMSLTALIYQKFYLPKILVGIFFQFLHSVTMTAVVA